MPPNIGLKCTGCGVGIEAFTSPIMDAAMKPPFSTISGFTPKKAGFQRTRSASFPTSTEPMMSEQPCAIAGLTLLFCVVVYGVETVVG